MFDLGNGQALIQSLDFITPVVDDPFLYGQIAAANSLSDIFAMGANALSALNILGFDACHFNAEIAAQIMAGGASKVAECGAALVGGHSVESAELFYGLSVAGITQNGRFWANNTAKAGDVLILSKPLGTGIVCTALKAGFLNANQSLSTSAFKSMSQLNFYALKALEGVKISATTDVTGFGLLGHLSEMASGRKEGIKFVIQTDALPVLDGVKELESMGLVPAGAYKNRNHLLKSQSPRLHIDQEKASNMLLFDPQTSGGLLLAIPQEHATLALKRLKEAGYEHASIIGYAQQSQNTEIVVM